MNPLEGDYTKIIIPRVILAEKMIQRLKDFSFK